MTATDLASRLGVSPETILRHCRTGRLPAICSEPHGKRPSRSWLIPEVEGADYLGHILPQGRPKVVENLHARRAREAGERARDARKRGIRRRGRPAKAA